MPLTSARTCQARRRHPRLYACPVPRKLPLGSLAAALGVAALLALLVYGVIAKAPDRSIESALAAGERPVAPTIDLPTFPDGPEASVADFRPQVVVLNYWASWCDPCRRESPALEKFHQEIKARDATVVGVNVKDVTSDAQAFIDEFDLSYPMLRDVDGTSQARFGITAYPETIVIDRSGRIAAIQRGAVDREWLETNVLPVIAEKPAGR